ncbi:hypothetical protein ABER99_20575 [Paenibacillus glucanolyticus]|uniref:Uncharacterized protein n=1 Tax=Paenibacillus glucanolyticus TaxID=59843 RepID=A0A168EWT0_9BACL|nr:hypothetical protein [Paenibacillus glucanolyticus]KZS44900.1 hypothetical protein AWU65_02640 [Paenibacillus glucanolyticus]OMF65552.1 hypothetical protein BK142_30540 [Paenibacillus glucanolyticus]
MKRTVSIVLLAVILSVFLLQSMAFAATDTGLLMPPGTTSVDGEGKLFSDEKLEQMKKDKEDASLTDGIMLGFILSLFNAVHISSLPTLIFGNPYGDSGTLNYGIFSVGEMEKIINPILGLLTGLYTLILTAAIMVSAAKFGLKAYSPQAKADFWTDINMWVLSAFFMGSFWLIFKVMMSINLALVSSMFDTLKATGADANGVSLIASAGNFNLGNAIVYLAEFGLTLYLNIIYIARKVIIIFLVVLSPFAAYSLIFAKTRAFFGTWMKELAGNIFLQSIHAITIFVFAQLSSLAGEGGAEIYATIYRLGLLIMFIPITGMISRWLNLGDSSSKLGQTATMMGAGSVAGAMMLAKGAGNMLGGKRAGGAMSGAMTGGMTGGMAPGSGSMSGSAPDMGSDAGMTALTMAAKGGSGWQKFKNIAGGVGAVAGGAVGLTMGPAGVAVGAKLGGTAVKGAMQGARNVSAGVKNSSMMATSAFFPEGVKSAYQSASGSGFFTKMRSMGSTGKENFSDMWNHLGERRRFMGNMGEALGSTVGAGAVGQKLGHMFSGASRGRVQGASEMFGGMNDMTLPKLAQKYAGQNVTWEQNNSGSAFYAQTANGKQRISNYGAADPTLKKGETRVADYKFPGHNEKFERQPNGSYKLSMPQSSQGHTYGPNAVEGPIGMSGGSNEHIARTSGAYIRGADGSRFEDNRVDAAKITPDNYFSHNIKGTDRRDWSDKGADLLSRKTKASTEYTPPTNQTKKLSTIANQAVRERARTKNKVVL